MSTGATILLVEDNPSINALNRQVLEMEGYLVLEAPTLQEARNQLAKHDVDLIVLDILLPDGSGLDFCRTLRQDNIVPVLFLTALGDTRQIVDGLRAGGDDYLSKPYDIDALSARIAALLRRVDLDRKALKGTEERLEYGPLRLFPHRHGVHVNGEDVHLTLREFELLRFLLHHPNQVHSRSVLYRAVWHTDQGDGSETLRVHINTLRKKLRLDENPVLTLETEYGQGYRMVVR